MKRGKQLLVLSMICILFLFAIGYQEVAAAPADDTVIKAEALYGATVRGGSYADQSAETGSNSIPREILEAKTAGNESYSRRSHLEFDIPSDTNWEETAAVMLSLYLHEHTGDGKEDTVQVLLTDKADLSEENWTWNNTDDLLNNAEMIGEQTFTEEDADTWVEIDVTAIKEHLQANPDKDFGIVLRVEEENDQGGIRFYSAYQDNGVYTPYLHIFQDEYQDTLPPRVQVTGVEDGATVTDSEVDVNIQATDNHDEEPTIHLTVNGDKVEGAQQGVNVIQLKEGKNTIEVYAEDAAGNTSVTQTVEAVWEAVTAFPVIADTYTDYRSPDQNHNGGNLDLKKAASDDSNQRETYLSFDLSDYDAPYVKEATIQFYINELMGNDRTSELVSIYQVEGFEEENVTWNNAPERGQLVAEASYERTENNTYGELDISAFINEELQQTEGVGTLHVVLAIDNGHDQKGVFINSKEQDQDKAARIQLVEGLPAPEVNIEGIEDGKTYTADTLTDVKIETTSVNESIDIQTEVLVNGEAVAEKADHLYDLPLQLGENLIEITATDQEGNQTEKTLKVTRLEQGESTVYYIDSEAGDDANDGLTEDTPWQSLERLNHVQFQPGSSILFKRGGSWQGQFRPYGSGTADQPITIDAYGEGEAMPKIEGNGISNADTGSIYSEGAIHLYDLSHWRIQNIEVTNNGEEIAEAARAGIIVIAGGQGDVENVHIDNVHVHDVNSGVDAEKLSGGIIFSSDTRDEQGNVTDIESSFHNISVENSHIHDVAIEGVRTKTRRNGSDTGSIHSSDVVIRKNVIKDTFGDAIVMAEVGSGGLVEKNIVRRHSSNNNNRNYAGVWLYQSHDAVIQYNEVTDGVYGYNDGEAFDFDIGTTDSVFQYNYTRNNRGGLLLTMSSAGQNNVFRHNISYNDGQGTELFYVMNNRTQIYNNTIYVGEEVATEYVVKDNPIDYMFFKNNILFVEGEIEAYSQQPGSFEAPNMSHNLIYPAELLELNGSPNPYSGLIHEDPKFVSNGPDYTEVDTWDEEIWNQNIAAFQLQDDSPAIGAGTAIDGMGSEDMLGNPIDSDNPTIGALQHTVEEIELSEPEVTVDNEAWSNAESVGVSIEVTGDDVTAEYQLNGTEGEWLSYDGDLQITEEGETTVYARAVDASGNTSDVAEAVVKLDRTMPENPVVELSEDGWTSSDRVEVNIESADDPLSGVAYTEYRMGKEGEWQPYEDAFAITTEGETVIEARTIDNAGNQSGVTEATAQIKRTAPSAPMIEPETSDWSNAASVSVSITGESDKSVVEYQLSDTEGEWLSYAEPIAITEEGETTVYARAVDQAGNVSEVAEAVVKIDRTKPELSLHGDNPLYVLQGTDFEDPGYEATDNFTKEPEVTVEGAIDTEEIDQQELVYTAKDTAGNQTSVTREVVVYEATQPSIILQGDNPLTIEAGTSYEEPGATAEDEEDGDLTDQIEITGEVDESTPGSYALVYQVTNRAGLTTTVTRYVEVVDTQAPELTLDGEETVTVELGEEYQEAGATAVDAIEGDVSEAITISGAVDPMKAGIYQLNYTVQDSSGNSTSVTRTVHVKDTTAPANVHLEVIDASEDAITLTFSAEDLAGIKQYILSRDGEEIAVVDGEESTYIDTEVESGIAYSYQLVAVDPSENQASSEPVEVTTDTTKRESPEVELDKEAEPVVPGDMIAIKGTNTSIQLPQDLPEGTTLQVKKVKDLEMAGLELAGEVYDFIFTYPEGEEDYQGNFILTMGVNDGVEQAAIYHFNEESNEWEKLGGERNDQQISQEVSHFSIYGVLAEVQEEDSDEEETSNEEENQPPIDDEGGELPVDSDENSADQPKETNPEEISNTDNEKSGDVRESDQNETQTGASQEQLPNTATNMFNWLAAGGGLLLVSVVLLAMKKFRKRTEG
ncbi:immunoglobulin-like domain-containing protein [Gracilibacillus phocaeensis]|uniref:immunoglobulin-like domain-containing protein n=1 Tax=Gracilibacillus phocaeensis TaxID=2042304 RepID=UPI0010302E58|nr:immunoglobulin-like domain-containing protein [Gracilibacillus phocaeensis]